MPAIPQSNRSNRPPVLPNPINPHPLIPNWLRSALSAAPLKLALFPPEVYPYLIRTVWTWVPATIRFDRPKRPPIPPNPITRRRLIANWLRSAVSARSPKLALFPPKLVAVSATISSDCCNQFDFLCNSLHACRHNQEGLAPMLTTPLATPLRPTNPFSNLNPLSPLQPKIGFVPLGGDAPGATGGAAESPYFSQPACNRSMLGSTRFSDPTQIVWTHAKQKLGVYSRYFIRPGWAPGWGRSLLIRYTHIAMPAAAWNLRVSQTGAT